MVVDFSELKTSLAKKLETPIVQTSVLLRTCRLIDDSSRLTSSYTDPRYLPFYYYLGAMVSPESVINIGLRLGLSAACFFEGCKTSSRFLGIQDTLPGAFYSPRLARGNIKDRFKGKIDTYHGMLSDAALAEKMDGLWDVAIIDEETTYDNHRTYLDVLWSKLTPGGLIVMDYVSRHDHARKAFRDFVRGTNRDSAIFATRYGVGIVQR